MTMTKQQAKEKIAALNKEIKELQNFINSPEITPEERFWQLMNGCTIYTEKENSDSVFWMKDGEVWFELENSTLWCRYSKVWVIFEKEYSMDYSNIQLLIKMQVEERFKMKGITPPGITITASKKVEERFKMKGITPNNK